MTRPLRRSLLLGASLLGMLASQSALADTTTATTTGAASSPAKTGVPADQNTTANDAGQANDKQSLTTSDIIVTGSASAQAAPITTSLLTTQPQSAVSRDFIDNANAGSDFYSLVALTPGVALTGNSNGPGLGETKISIRGFQDGEFNVTYDSIPFADTNNPTHHSTSFFPSNTIQTVVVDRGPGNASQLGQATFGGNVNLYSRAASDQMGAQLEGLVGNWSTAFARGEFNTGRISKLGGAKFVVTGQYYRSDGALTFSPAGGENIFVKGVIPLGSANTLTVLTTYNRNYYYKAASHKGATCDAYGSTGAPQGTTLKVEDCAATSDIGIYGLDFGLSNDPGRSDYWKYNRTDKQTDFSYLRLQSDLGSGFSMDNRVYMYGYTNHTKAGTDGTVVTKFNGEGTVASPYTKVTAPGDIDGYDKLNKYRVLGYIGQVDYTFRYGRIRVGGWYEYSDTDRHTIDFDWTTGQPSYDQKFNADGSQTQYPGIDVANIKDVQGSGWNQFQLFAEFQFKPTNSLSITPGVKYVHFHRTIDAAVNQSSRFAINDGATWTKTLPFLTANWQARSNWSFYAEYAQGMYVPDLSSFYSSSSDLTSALSTLQPETSTNYQVGTVWHGSTVSIDVDGYVINVNNRIGTCTTVGCDTTLLVNDGTVHYRGVEGSIAFMPVAGLTLFANGSYNSAHDVDTGGQLAKAPFTTAAAGFIYRKGGLRISFSQKYIGTTYATEATSGETGPRDYRMSPYSLGEFAISDQITPAFRLGVNVSNVFNARAIYAIDSGKTYGVDDQFNITAPRSFLIDARITL